MTELAGGELCLLQLPHNQVGAAREEEVVTSYTFSYSVTIHSSISECFPCNKIV